MHPTSYCGPQAHCGESLSPLAEYIHVDGYMAAPNLVRGKKVLAIAAQSLLRCVETEDIIAVGVECLAHFMRGHRNTVVSPYDGAFSLIEGSYNNLSGYAPMYNATHANRNNGHGHNILWSLIKGDGNTAEGHCALGSLRFGNYNTAHGDMAGYDLEHGDYNLYEGTNAGRGHISGSHCTFMRCRCPQKFSTLSNQLFIDELPDGTPLLHFDKDALVLEVMGKKVKWSSRNFRLK